MTEMNSEWNGRSSAPQSTVELIALLGRSLLASWKRYLGFIIFLAIIGFLINLLLIQYNLLFRGVVNQYITPVITSVDPIIQFFRLDIAMQYENLLPIAAIWLLVGFIVVVMREKGMSGLRQIPMSVAGSLKDIFRTGILAIILLLISAAVAYLVGLSVNNLVLVVAFFVTVLYALAARENGVLIMLLRLIGSDIKNIGGGRDTISDSNLISLGYPLSIVFGIWLGLLGATFSLLAALF